MSSPALGIAFAEIEVSVPFQYYPFTGPPDRNAIKCGEGLCAGPNSERPQSCGTWLNLPNYCCRVQVVLNNTIGEVANFPCDAVPGLVNTPFNRFANAAINTTGNCPQDTRHLNPDLSRLTGLSLCCPADEGILSWLTENEVQDYRCFDRTILDPSDRIITEPEATGTLISSTRTPSSTSQSTSSSTGPTTSESPSSTTELPSSNTSTTSSTTELPPSNTSIPVPTATSLPGSAPPGISKVSSLIFGTALLAMFLGAQL
ncbi:hypothetical protein TWF281_000362 [Arthrobotrys megalospora]